MPKQELAVQLAQQTIYLMGISFILGSLCTVFLLLVLDMMRANFSPAADKSNEYETRQG